MSERDDLLAALIEAEASSMTPPDSSRDATWAALVADIDAGITAPIDLPPSATPTVLATSSMGGVWWIVPIAIVGLVGVGGLMSPSSEPRVVAPPPPSPPIFASTTTVPAVKTVPPERNERPRRVKKRKKPRPPRQDLAAELALLRRAQIAMSQDDPKTALAALDEHRRRFPKGAIVEEQQALRVHVLCALGQTAKARRVGARFLETYPKSPQFERVKHACTSP